MKQLNQEIRLGQKEGTIFFVHGNSSSMRVFDPIFTSDQIEHSLMRLDLPGHGESYRSDEPEAYLFEGYRSAILDIVNNIGDDILLVGNSLGGHLCIEMAPAVNQLKGLLVFGAPPVRKPLNLEEAFNPFPALSNMFTEEVAEDAVFEMFSQVICRKEAVASFVQDFFKADPKVRSAMGADIAAGNFLNEAEIIQTLPVPRYLLQGDIDPTPNLAYIKSLINSKNPFELIELENCGHYPTVDQPEVFTQHLQRICKEVFGS